MDNEKTSLNIGILDYKHNEISMVCNYRYVDTCDIEKTTEEIRKVSSPFLVEVASDSPLLYYKKDSVLIKTLLKSYQEETGDYESKIKAIGGGTYAKEANNIVAFGAEFAGWDSKMHGVNEGCRKEDMIKSMSIYARAIKELGDVLDKNEN